MEKVFVDTDVVMDLLVKREPFHNYAGILFTLADMEKKNRLYTSSLVIANLNYMLTRRHGQQKARRILSGFRLLINVLPVDAKIIDLALSSGIKDFEDAIQYHTAVNNGIKVILTRNLKDYKKAEITVSTPESYMRLTA